MSLETLTKIEELKGRFASDSQLADNEDTSGGVETSIGDVASYSLFLDVEGAIDLRVYLSPDGGETWYEPREESPISFGGSNTDVYWFEYDADRIRLVGTNDTPVTAQVREVV
ncbi:hypothetical protein [Haloplanus rubicundus]|uniref:Uncharacterized protein n=1 Tax=Haloplanus rubicundus TaxID=1547898 RepID=A0A345EBA7_9EURY|nr:hypothetical protein [Haloplanus rubicundus]AXG09479.1 hypothetical protein DU484_06135 [Haloplanus rubicundus]